MQNNDFNELFAKFGAWVLSAITAVMAKISNEILNKRDLTWLQWIAIVGISLFWAWMAGLFCAWRQFDTIYSSIIIGLATLLGEKFNIYLSHNYKKIIDRVLSVFTNKNQ